MSKISKLPPGNGLGPPPEYFSAAQLAAWNDLLGILDAEAKNALTRGPIEIMACNLAYLRETGCADTEMQVAFRAWMVDFGLGEGAIEKLGLSPFDNVFPIE